MHSSCAGMGDRRFVTAALTIARQGSGHDAQALGSSALSPGPRLCARVNIQLLQPWSMTNSGCLTGAVHMSSPEQHLHACELPADRIVPGKTSYVWLLVPDRRCCQALCTTHMLDQRKFICLNQLSAALEQC